MNSGWIVIVVVVAFAIGLYRLFSDRPLGCRGDEGRRFAVLRIVRERIEGAKGTPREVEALTVWARRLDDRCLRAEYLKWIRYFDKENRRRAETDELFRRVDEIRRDLPTPPVSR